MKKLLSLLVFSILPFSAFAQDPMPRITQAQQEEGLRKIETSKNESCKAMSRVIKEIKSGKHDKLTSEEKQKLLPQQIVINCINSIAMEQAGRNLNIPNIPEK